MYYIWSTVLNIKNNVIYDHKQFQNFFGKRYIFFPKLKMKKIVKNKLIEIFELRYLKKVLKFMIIVILWHENNLNKNKSCHGFDTIGCARWHLGMSPCELQIY